MLTASGNSDRRVYTEYKVLPAVLPTSSVPELLVLMVGYTDKKEKKIFLIFKEIQMGAVAKSYMRKGFK
jgi:hypothetical protein